MRQQSKSKTLSPLRILWSGTIRLVRLCDNWISILGILLFAFSLIFMTSFWFYSIAGGETNQYFDALVILIVPSFFMAALAIIPVGVFLKHRREIRQGSVPDAYDLKVSDPRFRISAMIFIGITILVVLPVLAISSLKMYTFTESTQFCGQICHSVMAPQAVAHSRSSHARVHCAECHIGSGASFFVKSKISGLRQVYAVVMNTFNRPIPPAISELRPARDTCEECHWPSKFFGTQYKKVTHYSPDQTNTRREVEIMLKTGGASIDIGRAEGIHMHMLAAGKIEYVAADSDLQEITWIRHTRNDGEVTIYRRQGPYKKDSSEHRVARVIDCMDCHNRGAHHFASPQKALSVELETKRIDANLPFIMREATNVLSENYDDTNKALTQIERRLVDFYRTQFPDIWSKQEASIRSAIKRVQTVYQEQFFPEMKEDWRVYPENIGHQHSPGCFRCHDGLHVDKKGRAITSNCNTCHRFINKSEREFECLQLGTFQHSNTFSVHRRVLCSKCHGSGRYRNCRECHKDDNWSSLRGQGQLRLTDKNGVPVDFKPPYFNDETEDSSGPEETSGVSESKRIDASRGLDSQNNNQPDTRTASLKSTESQ